MFGGVFGFDYDGGGLEEFVVFVVGGFLWDGRVVRVRVVAGGRGGL